MDKKSIYINVAMGLGGNISLTYVTKELHEKYDKVCVMSPYYDCYVCDPYVDRVYKPEEARDFIFDAEAEDGFIMTQRIYDMSDFIKKRLSYSDAWRILCGLEPKGDGVDGSTGEHTLEVYKNYPALIQQNEQIMKQIKEQGYKDFILINFEGGVSPLQNVPNGDWSKVPDPYGNEPLVRNYPRDKAQKFVDLYRKANPKTAIINYSLPNQGSYVGTIKNVVPYLAYYELSKLPECKGAVTIDSSLQHLISGNCPVTTLWAHSLPNSFGHVGNKNIIQNCRRNDLLYFTMLGKSGAKVDYIEPEDLLNAIQKKESK